MNEMNKRLSKFYESDYVSQVMAGENDATESDGKRDSSMIVSAAYMKSSYLKNKI